MKHLACLFLVISTFTCAAQKEHRTRTKTVYAAADSINRTSVLPDNLFSGHIDGIVAMFSHTSKNYENPTFTYEIFWPAPDIDGDDILVVTKRQIILTTGHNNPNPDYIYWFANITPKQFENIAKRINASQNLFSEQHLHYCYNRQLDYKKFIPELAIPHKWSKKNIQIHEADHWKKTYGNASKLISIFNQGIDSKEQINFPGFEEFTKIKPVHTAQNAGELASFAKLQ